MDHRARSGLVGLACLGFCAATVSGVDLFDATLGTTPAAQGWLFLANPIFGHSVSQTPGPAFATLDSLSPRSDQGGYFSYFHPNLPAPLDRNAGFVVRFGLRIDAEGHNTRDDNGDGIDDRAGFSLIVVTSDLRALELGFWQNEVWAYADDSTGAEDLFTHAEGAAYDTTAARTDYELFVHRDRYTLLGAGVIILCGPLRDYSAFSGSPDVYETANFVFFGDDTASAESRAEIAYLAIEDAAGPCPADLAAPCAMLDFSDVLAFLGAFAAGEPAADLSEPFGVFDFSDVLAFLTSFGAGCP